MSTNTGKSLANGRSAAPRAGRLPVRLWPGRLAALALTGAALLPAGCASYSRDHVIVGSVPDDYRTRHPIVVKEAETYEDIVVAANSKTLSVRDREMVIQFASRYRSSGSTGMAIMIPSGGRNETAARRLAHQAAGVLQEKHVPAGQIEIYHYAAAGSDAPPLRLVYGALAAVVEGPCGQWDENVAETPENRNYANFGCATQQNLAAIIANPVDILGPRAVSEIDSTRRTKVITDWREDGTGDLPPLF